MKNSAFLLPDVVLPASSIYVCIAVPDNAGHRQAFAGALNELTRWYRWERDDDHSGALVAKTWLPIWYDVMYQLDQRKSSCAGDDTDCDLPPDIDCSGGLILLDEYDCEDTMQRFIFDDTGDTPQLVIDCGCGNLRRFELTAVTPPDAPEKKLSGGRDTVPVAWKTPITSANLDCYAVAAVDWIFDQAIVMNNFLVDAAVQGVDSLTGLDEIYEWAVLFVDLFNGVNDVWNLVEISKAQTAEVFEDPTLRATMAAAWTFNADVTRKDLWNWVKQAPYLQGGVQVRLLLSTWLGYSILQRINREFEMLGASCESGISLPDGGIPGAGGEIGSGGEGAIEEFLQDGQEIFPTYEWVNPVTMYDYGLQWTASDIGQPIAVILRGDVLTTELPSNTAKPRVLHGALLWGQGSQDAASLPAFEYILYTTTQSQALAQQLAPSATSISCNDLVSGEIIGLDIANKDGGAYIRIDSCLLIGAALAP